MCRLPTEKRQSRRDSHHFGLQTVCIWMTKQVIVHTHMLYVTPEKIPDLKLGSLLKSVQVLPISFLAEVGISVHKYASAHASDVGCSKAMPLIDGSVFFSNLEQINPYMYFLILVASNLPQANHVWKGSPQSWHRLEYKYSSAAYKPSA